MRSEKERYVKALASAGCIEFGNFILRSGKSSKVYIDIRRLYSNPRELRVIVEGIIEILGGIEFDVLCGIATGGLPLASVVAYEVGKPLIYLRKEKKKYGLGRLLEGDLKKKSRVVIVDDVATTGGSILIAANEIRGRDAMVEAAVVVVDRGEGSSETLMKNGVRLLSLVKLEELLSVMGRLSCGEAEM